MCYKLIVVGYEHLVMGSYVFMSLLCQLCCLVLGINSERKGESDYLW